MDLRFTEEIQELRGLVARFVRERANDLVDEHLRRGTFPRDVLQELAELGLMGGLFSAADGGTDAGVLAHAIVMEELAKQNVSLGAIFNNQTVTVPMAVSDFAQPAVRTQYLKPTLRCEMVGCFALTEPGAGSDVTGVATRAEFREGGYTLTGEKTYITHSPVADYMVVFARTGPDPHRGLSGFVVPMDSQGVSVSKLEGRLLTELSPIGEIHLDEVWVPEDHLLGTVGDGFRVAMSSLRYGRIMVAARAVGLAQFGLNRALQYARDREAFGQKVGSFQMVQRDLADMVIGIRASKSLLYQSAWQADRGYSFARDASIAKVFCTESAVKVLDTAISVCGGMGFMKEFGLDAAYARARISMTGEGSSNIQRVLIAEDALGWKAANRHELGLEELDL